MEVATSVVLDAKDYRSIAFGADHDHLVLTPIKVKDRRAVAAIDPKTRLPKAVRGERSEKSRWVAVGRSKVMLQ